MKFIQHFYLLAIGMCITLQSCKETPPYINFVKANVASDTSYVALPAPTPEIKNVLIEEFTGVQCPNCPAAQLEARTIADNNPGRINLITVHPLGKLDPLTRPFDPAKGDDYKSKYDFRTLAGAQIFEMVGISNSLPIGNINRKLFTTETSSNIDYQKWSAKVLEELNISTPVNISVSANNSGDSINIELTLKYTEAVTDSHYITLAVVESEITDVQEGRDMNNKTIFDEKYVHKHVLRAIVTDYFGDLLKAKLEPGRIFNKKYTYLRDISWVKTNLEVVAFIHLNTVKKNVIHSKETHVK
ncbi:MAG: Omp28-related outer membrane protein [Bacteroidia bacterium]|nr:Omp28-related outer membrane protein [Bacteroidia bacterium]